MDPIRPTLTSTVQPNAAPKAVDTARAAAQKAFFEIAMGKAPAAATAPVQASAPAGATTAAAVQRVSRAPQPGEAPARPLRPGSLLDIRV